MIVVNKKKSDMIVVNKKKSDMIGGAGECSPVVFIKIINIDDAQLTGFPLSLLNLSICLLHFCFDYQIEKNPKEP